MVLFIVRCCKSQSVKYLNAPVYLALPSQMGEMELVKRKSVCFGYQGVKWKISVSADSGKN